ncbi:MAG TPA: YcxB family protein [Acidobacteriaceae bacterium]|nr:YcxB family protein [Acidobacteriaceae bacterium]
MEIQATINFEEYRAMLEAMRKPPERSGRSLITRGLIALAFAVLFVIGLQTGLRDVTVLASIVCVLLPCLCWIWLRFRMPKCLRRTYLAQEKQLNGQIMKITHDGISGQWANGNASYRYAWQAFERLLDLPDSFVLLPNETSFVRVPKRSLTHDQQQEVKEWAISGIQKNKVQ